MCGIKFSIKATFEQHKKSHAKESEQLTLESESISNVANKLDENESMDSKNLLSENSTNTANFSGKLSKKHNIQCKADGCSATFTTQKQLKKHVIVIHKLATYSCPKCNKNYHSKIVYETHVRLCMPVCEDVVLIADEDIDSGPVECSTCSQLFENKKVLKFHQKICNDGDEYYENKGEVMLNQDIEEIYLKTEVEDDMESSVPEF